MKLNSMKEPKDSVNAVRERLLFYLAWIILFYCIVVDLLMWFWSWTDYDFQKPTFEYDLESMDDAEIVAEIAKINKYYRAWDSNMKAYWYIMYTILASIVILGFCWCLIQPSLLVFCNFHRARRHFN